MSSRLIWGVAALVCAFCITTAEAEAETVEVDFTSSRGSGFFEADLTNFAIPTSSGQLTTFDVIAADINITDPGWLFGQLHYTLDNVSQTSCSPAECSLVFRTNVVVPNFGIYNPTLQLNFDKIWIPWTTVDQQTIFMAFSSETFPNNWNANGSVERIDVGSAVPEPSTWAMMILGFGSLGFVAYLRRRLSMYDRALQTHSPILQRPHDLAGEVAALGR